MFIRRARTRTTAGGESCFAHRPVESRREGDRVRQKTPLNLGRHFPVARDDWPLPFRRVDEPVAGQATLGFQPLPTALETEARRIAKRLLERRERPPETPDRETVDIHSLRNGDARSIGTGHAAPGRSSSRTFPINRARSASTGGGGAARRPTSSAGWRGRGPRGPRTPGRAPPAPPVSRWGSTSAP